MLKHFHKSNLMYSLVEIFQFITQTDKVILKDYYDKSCNSLEHLNKRSNLISFFILIIFALFSFSSYITEFSVLGFKINEAIVVVTSPLLLSYFLLEWCLIARRRRELMKIIKHIGFNIFNIPAIGADYDFRHFSLHSRNIMPFSFLIEFLNVDITSTFRFKIFRGILILIFTSVAIYIIIALIESIYAISGFKLITFAQIKIVASSILCNVLAIACLLQIILFYLNELKLFKIVQKADTQYLQNLSENIAN